MIKNIQCDSCGQKYEAKNYNSMLVFSIILVGPFVKLGLINVFEAQFGELFGFLSTLLIGIILLFVYFKIVVHYEYSQNDK